MKFGPEITNDGVAGTPMADVFYQSWNRAEERLADSEKLREELTSDLEEAREEIARVRGDKEYWCAVVSVQVTQIDKVCKERDAALMRLAQSEGHALLLQNMCDQQRKMLAKLRATYDVPDDLTAARAAVEGDLEVEQIARRQPALMTETCPYCGGFGSRSDEPRCPRCHGTGVALVQGDAP